MKILVVEPAWDGADHLPANLGLLLILRRAYPEAQIMFVGGTDQLEAMTQLAPSGFMANMNTHSIAPFHDADTLIGDVRLREHMFLSIPGSALEDATLIILCSATATTLASLNRMGYSKKTFAYLHGNANDIAGWRSKNPFRRVYDLRASTKRFAKLGGRFLVFEERIRRSLIQRHSWLNDSISVIGHPILEDEGKAIPVSKSLSSPMRIGFPGLATHAKGFGEFLRLARKLTDELPDVFEFHGIGRMHPSCAIEDQSVLITKSQSGLPRERYVELLGSMHFLFTWHSEAYYSNAASGVIYDAVNLGIPIIARRSALVEELSASDAAIGLMYDNIEEAIGDLISRPPSPVLYSRMCAALAEVKRKHSTDVLAISLSDIVKHHFG